jgi:hypothetical protein
MDNEHDASYLRWREISLILTIRVYIYLDVRGILVSNSHTAMIRQCRLYNISLVPPGQQVSVLVKESFGFGYGIR